MHAHLKAARQAEHTHRLTHVWRRNPALDSQEQSHVTSQVLLAFVKAALKSHRPVCVVLQRQHITHWTALYLVTFELNASVFPHFRS